MKRITSSFLIGLSILLPVGLSLQLMLWMFATVERWLKSIWVMLIPEQYYFTGLALVSFVLIATLVGLSARLSFARQFWKLPGMILERTPLVNYVYSTIKDFLDLMGGKSFSDQSVVWVTLPGSSSRLLGIVTKTGDDNNSTLAQMMAADEVAVYLPMSYQAGGYMVVLPAQQVEKADIEPGEALRLIMSAGLGQRSKPALAASKGK